MRIAVIGASGLVGSNCLKYLSKYSQNNVLGTYFSFAVANGVQYDACEYNEENNFYLTKFAPEVIIHCGALTHVDYCEVNIIESYNKTVVSTANLLKIAEVHQAKFIYISTDYVFDGVRGPYVEDDEVNPVNVYGAHKLEAEQLVINSKLPYLILRITNVYGDEARNKNFVARLLNQISNKENISLKLPADQYATPINALDIARAIKILLDSKKSGTYHLGSTDYLSRYQLADKIIHKFVYSKAILHSVSTSELAQLAQRPLNGGLLVRKFLKEFPSFRFSNIDDYLANKTHV